MANSLELGLVIGAPGPVGPAGPNGGMYGLCTSAASIQEKTVILADFVKNTGAVVHVLMSNNNTYAGGITLNVNNTGADIIYINNKVSSSSNRPAWNAGDIVTFVYSGAYWYMIDTIQNHVCYGTCATSATYAAKVGVSPEFVLRKGALIALQFTNAQSYSGGAITLNVNSTGAKNIYYGASVTSQTNNIGWAAGALVLFVFDGTYWRVLNIIKGSLITTILLDASLWNVKEYNFADAYPPALYDIELFPCTDTTLAMFDAWAAAKIVGSTTANSITALGAVPVIDITLGIKISPRLS